MIQRHHQSAAPEPGTEPALARRCPATHPEDTTPCDGPPAVNVLDATNAGLTACEHHGARILASLERGRVYTLPDAPAGAAIRVFKAAAGIRPFPWRNPPRRPDTGDGAQLLPGGTTGQGKTSLAGMVAALRRLETC